MEEESGKVKEERHHPNQVLARSPVAGCIIGGLVFSAIAVAVIMLLERSAPVEKMWLWAVGAVGLVGALIGWYYPKRLIKFVFWWGDFD